MAAKETKNPQSPEESNRRRPQRREAMRKAVDAALTEVQQGISMREAARLHGIAYSALIARMEEEVVPVQKKEENLSRSKEANKAQQLSASDKTDKAPPTEEESNGTEEKWQRKTLKEIGAAISDAVKAVQQGMTTSKAAEQHGVSMRSIQRYIQRMKGKQHQAEEYAPVGEAAEDTGNAWKKNKKVELPKKDNKYNMKTMSQAFKEVEEGMSVVDAARVYGVTRSALELHIKRARLGVAGKRQELPEEIEKQVVDWCTEMNRLRCPGIRRRLPLVIQAILNSREVDIFPPDNIPHSGWITHFLRKHSIEFTNQGYLRPHVSYSEILEFFNDLQEQLKSLNLEAQSLLTRENASRVFYCDESGFVVDDCGDSKGYFKKTVTLASMEGKEDKLLSVVCCVSGCGRALKPLIINKGKTSIVYDKSEITQDSYNVAVSDSGWLTGRIFHSWLVNIFCRELTEKSICKPVILFLDGYFTDLCPETLRFARENGVIMYFLPPQAYQLLSPLDVGVFETLAAKYKILAAEMLQKQPSGNRHLAKKYFAPCFVKALQKCSLSKNVIGGFRATGLLPLNPTAVRGKKYKSRDGEDTSEVSEDESLEGRSDNEGTERMNGNKVILAKSESEEPLDRRLRRREPAQRKSLKTPADYYSEGYLAGQECSLRRFEALLPRDVLTLYHRRFRRSERHGQFYESSYVQWKELKSIENCEDNPYVEDSPSHSEDFDKPASADFRWSSRRRRKRKSYSATNKVAKISPSVEAKTSVNCDPSAMSSDAEKHQEHQSGSDIAADKPDDAVKNPPDPDDAVENPTDLDDAMENQTDSDDAMENSTDPDDVMESLTDPEDAMENPTDPDEVTDEALSDSLESVNEPLDEKPDIKDPATAIVIRTPKKGNLPGYDSQENGTDQYVDFLKTVEQLDQQYRREKAKYKAKLKEMKLLREEDTNVTQT